MFTIWAFDDIEAKRNVYRSEDYMKKIYKSLREHAANIIKFEKKKMIPLTKEQKELYSMTKICYIWKKKLTKKYG